MRYKFILIKDNWRITNKISKCVEIFARQFVTVVKKLEYNVGFLRSKMWALDHVKKKCVITQPPREPVSTG